MTAPAPPQIITRALTFSFAPSISSETGKPNVMEVALIPLDDGSSGSAGATFAGGLQTATIELVSPGPNVVAFDLIPSYSAGLSQPILYRVMWRAGITARTFTYDFSMPDADVDFEDLATGGNIITGETYLQNTDLGVPGRVARLNEEGHVVDSHGTPVATQGDLTMLENDLFVERVERQAGDASLFQMLEAQIYAQDTATLNTAKAYTNTQISNVQSQIDIEEAARINQGTNLQDQIDANETALQGQIDDVVADTDANTVALDTKADLVDGLVPVEQIPEEVRTSAVVVPDQAAMLALSDTQIHKGDVAVRPDGVWLLTTTDPSSLASWQSLTTVSSVNGERGAVTLSATDVGAIPVGGAISPDQVTGLATALSAKANQEDLATLQTQVSGIENSPTPLVRLNAVGVIPHELNDSFMVYLNSYGQLVKKNGDIIPVSGTGGGSVFSVNGQTGVVVLNAGHVGAIPVGGAVGMAQVTGLSTALTAKANQTDLTALAATVGTKADLVAGTVPLAQIPVLPQSKVTNLTTDLSANSNAISGLQTRVTNLEAGGGGEGGTAVSTTVFYDGTPGSAVTTLGDVDLHSPWGIDSDGTITGTANTWYYLHAGVRVEDVAYPFITQNGHLRLHRWNEAGPADPTYALQSDLSTLTTAVGTKAAQSALDTTNSTVATKANQSALTALSGTVDGKANQADLTALTSTVGTKAAQSALDATNATLATKANQSALDATNAVVATKAAQSSLTTLGTAIDTINGLLPKKADLDALNKVLTAQIPAIPQNLVTGLGTALTAKADLVAGRIPLFQLPSFIPMGNVQSLEPTLDEKADLVGGLVPVEQIPSEALANVKPVANKAALLALTPAEAGYGTVGIITGTSDKGTYILTGSDPSVFADWTLLPTPDDLVTSVNSKTGTVVLTYTDVGALAANAAIPISQVTGLQTDLNAKATTVALNTGLASKTGFADVQNMFYTSSMVKRGDYVSTTAIASLAGQQSVDGVLVPLGAIVLATNQSSSVNNGLYVVNSGAWTRPADFAVGSWLARDSVVVIDNKTASAKGTVNPNTIWQVTSPSGFIATDANNWQRIGHTAPPFAPVQGNGIAITGTYPALNIAAKVEAGEGLINTSAGLAVDDTQVGRKFLGTVPAGSTTAGITHGLNTTSPIVSIWDTGSNTLVLAGITVTGANAISIEFASPPAAGQYRVCVLG